MTVLVRWIKTARLPTSTLLLTSRNNVFVDGNDLSLQQRPVCNHEQRYLRWRHQLRRLGLWLAVYDFKLGDAGYVTPYGSVSGLFQSGDDYQLSNDMKVDGQSYDSMRYELGVDAGYTFTYSEAVL